MRVTKSAGILKAIFFLAIICILSGAFLFLSPSSAKPQGSPEADLASTSQNPPDLRILETAYQHVVFDTAFDSNVNDWKIIITSNNKTTELYWAEGRLLSVEQLALKEQYRRLLFRFPERLTEPSAYTDEEIEYIRQFSDAENRSDGPISSNAFFDAIFDTATRTAVEQHIVKTMFLGQRLSIHEYIVEPLSRIDGQLRSIAQTDPAVAEFIDLLETADGYSWRQIRDTKGRSFHSMGLALDLLPQQWQHKIIYWNWEKNKGNEDWMFIPLKNRWMPPDAVIACFEREGFVWGGKWTVWDNMHFEYRPELLAARDLPLPY